MPRWSFYDGADTYLFEVNPNAGGSPKFSKRFSRMTPTSPEVGFTIRQEGRPEVPTGQFTGVIRSQEQYQTFVQWFLHTPVIRINDDLGRTFLVVPLRFTPTPGYRRATPWRVTYTFEYALVSPAVI